MAVVRPPAPGDRLGGRCSRRCRCRAGPLLANVGFAVAAVVLYLASSTGGYGSAFGRLAFASSVPQALVSLPLQAVSLVALSLEASVDLVTVDSIVTFAAGIWMLIFMFLAFRVAVGRGAAVVGTILTVLVLLVPVLIWSVIALQGQVG